MNKKNKKWYRLDNAAKIFPPTTDKNDPKTFRFSISLKEEIEPNILQEALDLTLEDFPIFRSKLEKGFFWYYLEELDEKPLVTLERVVPCDYIEDPFLFQVMHFRKRISLEVSHALTDGTGTLFFLKGLTAKYLNLKYQLEEENLDISSVIEKSSDSYDKYYKKTPLKLEMGKEKAYHLKGEFYPEGRLKMIEGRMSTKAILALAKKEKTTLTIYLTALLIQSIGKNMTIKERKKPIYITVPVNLRNYFPSDTVRNFFNTITVSCFYQEQSLNQMIEEVKHQFEKALMKEKLEENMNHLARLERIFIIRLIPLFIKDLVLKFFYQQSKNTHTMTLSNIGKITMSNIYEPYIDYFDVFASTDGIQVCLCSYQDELLISFSSHFTNTEIEKNFFRSLTSNQIKVTIHTNLVEEESNDEVL